jgi:hypothetical protein
VSRPPSCLSDATYGGGFTEPRFIHRPLLGATSLYVRKNLANALDQYAPPLALGTPPAVRRLLHSLTEIPFPPFAHRYKPHLIVSVHPLLQHVVLNVIRNRVKRGLMEPVPFATVVTDLTKCHPTWYHKDVTACFVPTDVCRQQALDLVRIPEFSSEPLTSHTLPPPLNMRFEAHIAAAGVEWCDGGRRCVRCADGSPGPACDESG